MLRLRRRLIVASSRAKQLPNILKRINPTCILTVLAIWDTQQVMMRMGKNNSVTYTQMYLSPLLDSLILRQI